MWLKLETGILLMLLLFSVLAGERQKKETEKDRKQGEIVAVRREKLFIH